MMTKSPFNEGDLDLFLRYQSGDGAAFERLYHRWSPKLYGWLTHRVGAGDLRDDLLQIIWAKLHSARMSFRPQSELGPWIFAIARNCVIDAHRRTVTRPEGHLVEGVELSEIEDPASDQQADGWGASDPLDLSRLTVAQRQLIRFRFEEDLTFEEIAKKLATPAATLRQRLGRALKRIREGN